MSHSISKGFAPSTQAVFGILQLRLTQRLTAYILGLSDGREVGCYAHGDLLPGRVVEDEARALADLLGDAFNGTDDRVVQLWFQGHNPELVGNDAPARALRSNLQASLSDVQIAAEAFAASER
jgi:hypothetical protein